MFTINNARNYDDDDDDDDDDADDDDDDDDDDDGVCNLMMQMSVMETLYRWDP